MINRIILVVFIIMKIFRIKFSKISYLNNKKKYIPNKIRYSHKLIKYNLNKIRINLIINLKSDRFLRYNRPIVT